MSRLATASLAITDDEPDVTSINAARLSRDPMFCRVFIDYLIYRRGDPAAAVRVLSEATKAAGYEDWWFKNRLGRCFAMLGLYSEAEAQFQSSLRSQITSASRIELVNVLEKVGQGLRAIKEAEDGASQFPRDPRFALAAARIQDGMGNFTGARDNWRKALSVDSVSVEALANMGSALFYEQGEVAEKFFRTIFNLGGVTCETLNNLAICCLTCGDWSIVAPALLAALGQAKTAEERSDVWYNISHVAVVAGMTDWALQALTISTSISSHNADALNNLGILELKRRNTHKAVAAFEAAATANPAALEPRFNLALMYERLGQIDKAFVAAQAAVQIGPTVAEVRSQLLMVERELR